MFGYLYKVTSSRVLIMIVIVWMAYVLIFWLSGYCYMLIIVLLTTMTTRYIVTQTPILTVSVFYQILIMLCDIWNTVS